MIPKNDQFIIINRQSIPIKNRQRATDRFFIYSNKAYELNSWNRDSYSLEDKIKFYFSRIAGNWKDGRKKTRLRHSCVRNSRG